MKILYVHNSSKYGGMEQHVLDLVRGMEKMGHKVYVWCPEGSPAIAYRSAGADVTIKNIQSDLDIRYISELTGFLKHRKIDIVHSHELKAGINVLIASKLAKVKVVVTHTHTPISEWKIGKFHKKINTKIYAFMVNHFSDVEIALTESKKKVKTEEGIKEEKIAVIPNGLDIEEFTISPMKRLEYREEFRKKFNISEKDFVFGNVSRLSPEKGHDVLLEAFHKFVNSDLYHSKKLYLMISGGGKLEESLRDVARKKGIEDKVIITGEFQPEELIKYYSTFDVFIFPTLAEGFGIVLIEALYAGLPVICSDLEVLKEVAGDTATYFSTGNPLDLSVKMAEIYENFLDGENIVATYGKDRVAKLYTMDAFVKNYLNLYQNLMDKK